MSEKIGRNDPCPCDSGKKFKKCCLGRPGPTDYAHVVDFAKAGAALRATGRSPISTLYQGRRVRAVGSRVWMRPEKETWHEFLLVVLSEFFGKGWLKSESEKPLDERHIVAQWYAAFVNWRKKNGTPENAEPGGWSATTDGPTQALMQLAYDVYSLQHNASLPNKVAKRLRDREAFQGVLYEVAVAAIFARLGYKIDWESDNQEAKHCEFIATHPMTKYQVGVEAKSRRRSGVLHQPVTYEGPVKMKGDIGGLLDKALTQKPAGLAFVVFVDLNLPATAEVDFKDKPWMADIKVVLDRLPSPSDKTPDKFNAVFVTNFAAHCGKPGDPAPAREYLFIGARFPETPFKSTHTLTELLRVMADYGQIPDPERN